MAPLRVGGEWVHTAEADDNTTQNGPKMVKHFAMDFYLELTLHGFQMTGDFVDNFFLEDFSYRRYIIHRIKSTLKFRELKC